MTTALEALDLEPPGTLWLRLSGPSGTFGPRVEGQTLERSLTR